MMEEQTIFVFGKHPEKKHLMTDSFLWEGVMNMRAMAERNYHRQLEKVMNRIEKIVEAETSQDKDGCRREVGVVIATVNKQIEQAKQDEDLYDQCGKDIESLMRNGDSSVLALNRKRFKALMSDYELQKDVIELKKAKYLKRSAELEREEIKKLFAPDDRTITEKYEYLKTKAEKATKKYETSIAAAETIINSLKKASTKYETDWKTMEERNCRTMMELVTKSVEESHAWKFCSRDIDFSHVDIPEMLEEQVTRVEVNKPAFVKYKETEDKDALLSQLLSDGELDAAQAKRQKALVLQAYKKQSANEISIKKGGKLKQILPANDEGYAYGIYKKHRLSKAKKGFYPAANVRLLE